MTILCLRDSPHKVAHFPHKLFNHLRSAKSLPNADIQINMLWIKYHNMIRVLRKYFCLAVSCQDWHPASKMAVIRRGASDVFGLLLLIGSLYWWKWLTHYFGICWNSFLFQILGTIIFHRRCLYSFLLNLVCFSGDPEQIGFAWSSSTKWVIYEVSFLWPVFIPSFSDMRFQCDHLSYYYVLSDCWMLGYLDDSPLIAIWQGIQFLFEWVQG